MGVFRRHSLFVSILIVAALGTVTMTIGFSLALERIDRHYEYRDRTVRAERATYVYDDIDRAGKGETNRRMDSGTTAVVKYHTYSKDFMVFYVELPDGDEGYVVFGDVLVDL